MLKRRVKNSADVLDCFAETIVPQGRLCESVMLLQVVPSRFAPSLNCRFSPLSNTLHPLKTAPLCAAALGEFPLLLAMDQAFGMNGDRHYDAKAVAARDENRKPKVSDGSKGGVSGGASSGCKGGEG